MLQNHLIFLTLSSTLKNQNTAKILEFGKFMKIETKLSTEIRHEDSRKIFGKKRNGKMFLTPWALKNRDPFITVEKRTGNQLTSFKMDRNSKCVLRSALNNSWNGKKNPLKGPSKVFQRINLTDISSLLK